MKLINNKKAIATLVLSIALVVIIIGIMITLSGRECKTDKNCRENSYCGSDFKCHEFPIIKEVVFKNGLFWPSIFIGICIIISALILSKNRENKGKNESKKQEPTQAYYQSQQRLP